MATTNDLVNESSELANRAIKYLHGAKDDKGIYRAVLLACPEMPDLMTNEQIAEATTRIKAAQWRANGNR